jgi:hypothetical protein
MIAEGLLDLGILQGKPEDLVKWIFIHYFSPTELGIY